MSADDEFAGELLRPRKGVRRRPSVPRRLVRHRSGARGACAFCCRPALAYVHPNPLRRGVVLWRCRAHSGLRFAQDDPKAAPGGGRYW